MTTDNNPTPALNVLGTPLQHCCSQPKTGFYRDGFCHTGPMDMGSHVVCAQVTEAFLQFSASRGNDLMTASPEYDFPGLKPGDRWCLCASRWYEAFLVGVAPPVALESCHQNALLIIPMEALQQHRL